jgi:hypothetical protein
VREEGEEARLAHARVADERHLELLRRAHGPTGQQRFGGIGKQLF